MKIFLVSRAYRCILLSTARNSASVNLKVFIMLLSVAFCVVIVIPFVLDIIQEVI